MASIEDGALPAVNRSAGSARPVFWKRRNPLKNHRQPSADAEPGKLAADALLSADLANIRRSIKEIEDGKFKDAGEYFDGLHARLLAMQAANERR